MSPICVAVLLYILAALARANPEANVIVQSNQPRPLPYKAWADKKIMFIYAHIDDMEGTSGGLTSLISNSSEVHLLILTNGDKGCGNDSLCGNMTNAELSALRQSEQLTSAALLGVQKERVYFLDYEDCLLSSYPTQQVLAEIVTYIRRVQPDIVLTWDPTPYFNLIPSQGWDDVGYHPDHQTSGKLTVDAVWLSSLPRAWPEAGAAWRVPQLYFWSFSPTKPPQYYVDVTGEPYDRKTQSFLAMQSQYGSPSDVYTMLNFLGSQVAAQVHLPAGHFAEGFDFVLW